VNELGAPTHDLMLSEQRRRCKGNRAQPPARVRAALGGGFRALHGQP
jgi:hypothetical protein